MRMYRLVFPVLLALSLSACTGTMEGLKADAAVVKEAMVEEGMPTGYPPNPNRRVLKPPSLADGPVFSSALEAPGVWQDVGDYDRWATGSVFEDDRDSVEIDLSPIGDLPAPQQQGVSYNDDVSVFPIDGIAPGGMTMGGDKSASVVTFPLDGPVGMGYGRRPDGTVYFGHGSSTVRAEERKKINALARRARREMALAVSIVGHASRRVDGVTDPVKKAMINLRMAQKRADAVTRELKKAGLKPAWVQAVSRGDKEPNRIPPPGMTQEAANRRVEIFMDRR